MNVVTRMWNPNVCRQTEGEMDVDGDLDQITLVVVGFFAAMVLLLVVLDRLEASLGKPSRRPGRRPIQLLARLLSW